MKIEDNVPIELLEDIYKNFLGYDSVKTHETLMSYSKITGSTRHNGAVTEKATLGLLTIPISFKELLESISKENYEKGVKDGEKDQLFKIDASIRDLKDNIKELKKEIVI